MDNRRRFGRVYVRRRNRQTNIQEPNNHLLEINELNGVRRPRAQRTRRTNYSNLTAIFNHAISVKTTHVDTNVLIDIPVQLQRQQDRTARICHMPQTLNTMFEVPIEVVHTNAEIHFPTVNFTTPISSTRGPKRPRPEDNDIVRAPLGTFTAPASTSGARKKPRTSRLRRLNFDHIILPTTTGITNRRSRGTRTIDDCRVADRNRQRNYWSRLTPEQRAARQALDTARRRATRARNRSVQQLHINEPVISLTERNRIRKRKSRASQTMMQRIVSRAINTLQQRNSRHRQSQQSNDGILAPPSNAQLFRKAISELEWGWCVECNTRFPDMLARGLCDFCKKDKEKHPEGSLFSAANMMDPGNVPIELSRLTDLESLLIARVHPMMSVYRVKGQQYKYSGNVINFVQDVNRVAPELPYKPTDLTAILIVKRTGNNSTKEFVVRREYVRQALLWLKQNHRYYGDLSINDGTIDELPEDGIPNGLPDIEEDNHEQDETTHSNNHTEHDDSNGPPELQEENFHIDQFHTAGIVGASIQPNQQRCIRRALEMAEVDQTTAHLPFTGEVIDEFTREGYITMAFPTLFPYGTTDLRQPRLRKVRECQYFQYLMKYHDGRFARDSRFRYFALNSLTRWRALALGEVYVNKNPQDGELSIQAIRDMVSSGDTRLASRVSYYAKQIRGTRAYWYTRLKELIAMVRQLGPPTIFFTLSAADLQWPELYTLLDPTNKLQTLNPMDQKLEKAKLLNENPLLASWFFQKRVQLFFKCFLNNEFSVVNHWYRFEWQNRGSGHVHGFLWVHNRPNVSQIATNDQVRRLVCQYFDNMVCTMNLDPTFSANVQEHPCAKKIPIETNLNDDIGDYISLVNCVMRHSRCGSYCKRKSKATGQELCRFKFPMELLEESKIVEEPPDSNMYRFMGRRNDPLVNSHNRVVLQTWRANIDWSGVITTESVTHYIGKYAAKSEPASKNFLDTLRGIIDDPRRPCRDSRSAIKCLLIKNASERDISAPEVCHLLTSYHLRESSRKVVLLNLNENSLLSSQLRRRRNDNNEETLGTDPSFVGRYLERPEAFQQLSLLEMAKKHYYARKRWCKYKVEAVIRVLPELEGKIMPNTEKWETFCMQQVLLNHSYRSIEEAKGGFQLWSERYNELGYANQSIPPTIGMVDDEFEDEDDDTNEQLEDWMTAAGMAPGFAPTGTIELGLRTHDVTHDWSEGLTHYPSINDDRRFTHTLGQNDQELVSEFSTSPPVALGDLSQQQKAAHDLVLQSMRDGRTIRLIVSGGAGTGKSTLINAIVHSTRDLFRNNKAVKIMAPTGVAAYNIGGATIHHELAIAVDKNQTYKQLEMEQCGRMQEEFKDTKLIVIDEYSMIGRKMLANIDLRCRDIFSNTESFGNVSVVLVGDMRQLPPVCDTSLYVQVRPEDNPIHLLGSLSYSSFGHCVQLSQVFRQSGDEESLFRDALLRLSDGKSTPQDWSLFNSRDYSMFTVEEKNNFKYALRLFPTKDVATDYNHERLKDLGNPIARIASKNNCDTARRARSDEAKGLQDILLLSKGARVMLRTNLATRYGLVNGARGIVVDIVYRNEEKSPTHMPLAVMVEFDKYTGPTLYQQRTIIPIVPQTTNWKSTSGVTCQRTQIPLILCWAITVHKSQGLTLDQAVVNIGQRESLGLTFVALSRTRKLRDLAFYPMFNYERLQKISQCKGLLKRRQEEERLQQLSRSTL